MVYQQVFFSIYAIFCLSYGCREGCVHYADDFWFKFGLNKPLLGIFTCHALS